MDGQRLLGWPTWVGIIVEDLPRQRQFWAELLGVPEDHSGPDFVDFEMGGGHSFELIRRSDHPEYDRKRFQVGFAVDDIRPCVPNSFVEESNGSGTSSTTRPGRHGPIFAIRKGTSSKSSNGLRRRIGQAKEAFIREIVEDLVGRNADREPRSDGRLLSEGLEPSFQPQRRRRPGSSSCWTEQGGGVRSLGEHALHHTTGGRVLHRRRRRRDGGTSGGGRAHISGPVFWDGEDDVAWVHFRAPDATSMALRKAATSNHPRSRIDPWSAQT
jgi:hypothetical protein